jgi:hypothetical protein
MGRPAGSVCHDCLVVKQASADETDIFQDTLVLGGVGKVNVT